MNVNFIQNITITMINYNKLILYHFVDGQFHFIISIRNKHGIVMMAWIIYIPYGLLLPLLVVYFDYSDMYNIL